MGHLLFRLNKNGDAVLDPDAIALDSRLAAITEQEQRLVIYFVDYFGPFNQLNENERLKRAKRKVYGKDDIFPEKAKNVIAAIEAYGDLQYDVRRDALRKYREKVGRISDDLLNEEDYRKIPQYHQAIKVLNDGIRDLQAEIDMINYSDEETIEGGGTVSFIERWQENQRQAQTARQKKASRKILEEE